MNKFLSIVSKQVSPHEQVGDSCTAPLSVDDVPPHSGKSRAVTRPAPPDAPWPPPPSGIQIQRQVGALAQKGRTPSCAASRGPTCLCTKNLADYSSLAPKDCFHLIRTWSSEAVHLPTPIFHNVFNFSQSSTQGDCSPR